MIDASPTITTQTAKQSRDNQTAPASDETPAFSYALASTTLQSQAALSLEVHGTAPSESTAAVNNTQQSNNRGETRGDVSRRPPEAQTGRSETAPQHNKHTSHPPVPAIDRTQQPIAQAAVQQSALPVANAAIAAASQLNIQQFSTQPKDTAILREAAAAKDTLRAQKTAQAAKPTAPQLPQQEFARLLARRLDTATSFELRLDPPELGRVEGRFTVSDDGKSVLSLKFDNQSAFDLFAKDEAALRTALSNAGFDLGDSELAFTLNQQTETEVSNLQTGFVETPFSDFASYDPVFNADYSSGAIDIRI